MCIIKDLSLPSSLCLIAAAFVFVQCLQQAPAAAATKAADAAADAPMAFSMSTGRSPRCHSAFEPWGEIKAYLIVIKLLKIWLGLCTNGTFLKTRRKQCNREWLEWLTNLLSSNKQPAWPGTLDVQIYGWKRCSYFVKIPLVTEICYRCLIQNVKVVAWIWAHCVARIC